jgi:GrpB-like predicted nucleotidyltransferase (UPF0157 family)
MGLLLAPVKSARVAVVPYDAAWAARFAAERALLERVLAPWASGGIHHVGSTAIPGLAAKPIVDVVAGVRDLDESRAAFAPLADASYVPDPHRPGIAHHFAKPAATSPEYGLHLTEPGSDLWRERLVFRDALLADGALRAEYEDVKHELARRHPHDVDAYTSGKRAFVERVLARAGLGLGRR